MGAFLASFLGKLCADEIKAWLPWVAERLTKAAVRKLPPEEQERYSEEWRSYLDEVPGALAKIWAACGFLNAARKAQGYRSNIPSQIGAFVLAVLFLPLIVTILLIIKLNSDGECVSSFPLRDEEVGRARGWLSYFAIPKLEPPELTLYLALRFTPPGPRPYEIAELVRPRAVQLLCRVFHGRRLK